MSTDLRTRISAALTRLPAPHVIFWWLVGAHVVAKLIVFLFVMHSPVIGDESSYLNGGRALSNGIRDLVAFRGLDTEEINRNVVSSGWFMPGMMVVTAPLFLVVPDASIEVVRGYLGLFNMLLFLGVVLAVKRAWGHRWAIGLLVLPGLVPMWLRFTFGAWGDLPAGVLCLALLVVLIRALERVRLGEPVGWRTGLQLGLLAIAVVYLRSSASILVVGLCAVLGIVAVLRLRGAVRWRSVGAMALAGVAFLAGLAPWSLMASHYLDDRVLTTTSVSNVTANTFGDRAKVCFGPCDPDSSIWFGPVRYAREVSRATGASEVEVQKQMSAYARTAVTPRSYAEDVVRNTGDYFLNLNRFDRYFKPLGEPRNSAVQQTLALITVVMVYAALLLTVVGILRVFRSSWRHRWLGLTLTLSVAALLTQPFVHIAGGRYWPTLAPLLGLMSVLVLSEWMSRRPGGVPSEPVGTADLTLARWVDRCKMVVAVGFVLVVAVVLVLGL